MNLKGELHNLKKGSDTVDVYLQKIEVVKEKFLVVGVIVDDEELLHIAIKGSLKSTMHSDQLSELVVLSLVLMSSQLC